MAQDSNSSYSPRKKRRRVMMRRKRVLDSSLIIDYKKPDVIRKFITERGKIIPSRVSGATHAQQLAITKAVKRARYLALIPCSVAHEKEKGFVGEMSDIAQTFAMSASFQRSSSFRDRGPRTPRDAGEGEANASVATNVVAGKDAESKDTESKDAESSDEGPTTNKTSS